MEISNKKDVTNMLISSSPKTKAQEGVRMRARQLTDFKWTPLRDIPTFTRKEGNWLFEAGRELTGFPYSSVEVEDRFITENVSFESFLSAIANPHSKLYQVGHGEHGAPNFGVVCNGLVRYALGIPRRVSTKRFLTIPGMNPVAKCGAYTAEDLALFDVLYSFGNGVNHVELITDILRTETNEIAEIELSGGIRPLCARRRFTVHDFFEKFGGYDLCRYEFIESIPYDESVNELLWNSHIEKKTPKIAVDNGNNSNYLVGDEVLLSVFSDLSDVVELLCGDTLLHTYAVGGSAMIPLTLPRGYYTARLQSSGESVSFCVNRAEVAHRVENGVITFSADPCDPNSEIVYLDFREKGNRAAPLASYEELSEEERQSGCFSRRIPQDARHYKIYYRNQYGVWTHPMTKIWE